MFAPMFAPAGNLNDVDQKLSIGHPLGAVSSKISEENKIYKTTRVVSFFGPF